MSRAFRPVPVLVLLVAFLLPGAGTARASYLLGDRDVTGATLVVSADGVAVVSYTTADGAARHVLATGAVNALANPTAGAAQAAFSVDYSGGWKSHGRASWWQLVRNACGPYTGPPLPLLVTACTAPDGSYWALQAWQRNLPMRGFDPWTAAQRAVELHLSHWSGDLPQLEIAQHWTYGATLQGFFGRLRYGGQPVFGTRTASATVSDTWARNIYIDTLDSDYGPGWHHDTAIAVHTRDGGFCYSFVLQQPPAGYPSAQPHGNGLGTRYRVTVDGPGVEPVIQWEAARLTAQDPSAQAAATAQFDAWLGQDAHCAPER